jgi:hypothetical protein
LKNIDGIIPPVERFTRACSAIFFLYIADRSESDIELFKPVTLFSASVFTLADSHSAGDNPSVNETRFLHEVRELKKRFIRLGENVCRFRKFVLEFFPSCMCKRY